MYILMILGLSLLGTIMFDDRITNEQMVHWIFAEYCGVGDISEAYLFSVVTGVIAANEKGLRTWLAIGEQGEVEESRLSCRQLVLILQLYTVKLE